MPLTMSNSILSTPRGRLCRQLTMALAALAALFTVASTAQAKTNHRYTSVIQTAPLSTASGYPAPGGTAVVAGTWKTNLYGNGAVVDRVRITGNRRPSRSPSAAPRSASPPSARSRTPLPAQPLYSRTEAKRS